MNIYCEIGPRKPKTQNKILIRIFFVLLITFFITGLSNKGLAQNKVIVGIIVDNGGEAIPGVNIALKGTNTVVSSDASGKYSIRVPNNQSVLVFSSIGFTKQEVVVGSRTNINITLAADALLLNQVVIQTGYGQTVKRDVTGSIGTVSMADLQKAPVTSFEQALAGRVAGVQVISGDGQPGDGLSITIRGNNSINNSNSPLYVIDGFPIEDPDNNAINPAEIESIDILKDASATAIYGSRGANGVIIITTKRGKLGEPTVSYNGYYGTNKIIQKVELMNPYEFVKLQSEINPTSTQNALGYFKDGKTLESYRNIKGADFQDKIYETAPFQNHYLSVNGGTEKTKYSVSGSVTDQKGIIVNSGFTRYQGRAVLDQNLGKKFKIGTNINYSATKSYGQTPRSQNNQGGNDVTFNLLYQVWSYRPITGSNLDPDALFDEFLDPENDPTDGSPLDYRVNPYSSFINEYRGVFNNTFVGNTYLEYAITKNLQLRSTAGVNLGVGRTENFFNSKTRQGSPLTPAGKTFGVNGSIAQRYRNDYSVNNLLTYTKKFNQNNQLSIKALYEFQINETQNFGYQSNFVPNENLGIAGLGRVLSLNSTTSSSMSTYKLQSFGAIFNYQFMGGKYIFTGNFRADGSSKFREGKRYGYFPSAALAWRFSEEKFIKNLNLFSTGKLRGGYGIVGNNRIGDFAYISQLASGSSSTPGYYPFGNVVNYDTQAFYIEPLGNRDIKWETTGSVDIGLELGFLSDKITLETDYYKKDTYDLLLNANLSASSGLPINIINNIGRTRNEGVEFTLNSQLIKNDKFTWNTSFNITFNKNQIVALTDGQRYFLSPIGGSGNTFNGKDGYIAHIGRPISSMYGFIYDGNYQVEDFDLLENGSYILKANIPVGEGDIGQARTGTSPVQPGDPKYRDVNGDGLVNNDDKTVIGNPNPLHFGGLSNNFRYKAFDLNVFLQWSYGNETMNANRLYLEGGFPAGFDINQFASYANRWTPENRSNTMFRANARGAVVYSSRIIEDASFIRLKTVQFGYTVPPTFIKKLNLKSARLYASAQNLFTLTNYSSTDPENSTRGTGTTAGYDFSAYPRAFTVTFGLNVSL
ncbi:TonB-dependent receptor [Pedobacter frigiditerrae]|uniref:TonB-dependent receptor n=1 Tax=Pedobacter frigiditerrae TaxID=2530452 RepID=A0A4R0MQS2_9SPHI|nr:TonB-dependent receptor [Pedobacter frigiditerrae]TCC88622.1 TonB-dependent receptor [Pedobacter frigiditerrae]